MASKSNDLPMQTGLVVSYFGNSVAVEADNGQEFLCHLHRNQSLPVVGDRVHWQLDKNNTGTVLDIEPRRSLFARGDVRGKQKPIAANIDCIVVVMSPPPVFSEYLIDRYLLAASLVSIPSMLVLNKTDLLDDVSRSDALSRLAVYQTLGCPAAASSTYAVNGLSDLSLALRDKTAVLVGPSGVGKSSIIAGLSDTAIRVSDVSTKGAGKHTTTATRLYHLPSGGSLIDSPGVREFNLWPVSRGDILRGFSEFATYALDCKFRDCAHLAEPGCAVKAAVESGKISDKRYASYQELIKNAISVT